MRQRYFHIVGFFLALLASGLALLSGSAIHQVPGFATGFVLVFTPLSFLESAAVGSVLTAAILYAPAGYWLRRRRLGEVSA